MVLNWEELDRDPDPSPGMVEALCNKAFCKYLGFSGVTCRTRSYQNFLAVELRKVQYVTARKGQSTVREIAGQQLSVSPTGWPVRSQ